MYIVNYRCLRNRTDIPHRVRSKCRLALATGMIKLTGQYVTGWSRAVIPSIAFARRINCFAARHIQVFCLQWEHRVSTAKSWMYVLLVPETRHRLGQRIVRPGYSCSISSYSEVRSRWRVWVVQGGVVHVRATAVRAHYNTAMISLTCSYQ
jgi:hypothetical protein